MLPPLATLSELELRAGFQAEAARAEAVLADVSALAREEAGRDWMNNAVTPSVPNPPDVVITVVLKAAKRALENPDGLSSETVGDYTWRKEGTEDGVYLTDRECRILRRVGGKSGLWTQPTTRVAPDECGTGFVDDQFGLEPFPYYKLEC